MMAFHATPKDIGPSLRSKSEVNLKQSQLGNFELGMELSASVLARKMNRHGLVWSKEAKTGDSATPEPVLRKLTNLVNSNGA
jgi:hypothetical protein